MFDRRLMLSYLDGLITESQKSREKKIREIEARGGEGAKKAVEALKKPHEKRKARYEKDRARGEVVPGRKGREEAAAQRKATSHSSQLEKRLDTIHDLILDRIGTKDPERKEELRDLRRQSVKLGFRLKKVKQKEQG